MGKNRAQVRVSGASREEQTSRTPEAEGAQAVPRYAIRLPRLVGTTRRQRLRLLYGGQGWEDSIGKSLGEFALEDSRGPPGTSSDPASRSTSICSTMSLPQTACVQKLLLSDAARSV